VRLDTVTAAIRPRRPWEAVDLGFALARRCWRPLLGVWACTMLPLALLLYTLLPVPSWAAGLLLWWSKPLFDRPILHILSRDLFGARPGVGATLRALPGLLARSGSLFCLTLGRFDMARSYSLPVWQLEGQRGPQRRERLRVLQRRERGTAVWLTVLMLHFELLLVLTLAGVIFLLIPTPLAEQLGERIATAQWPYWLDAAVGICSALVLAFTEPLYVGGGFALYLNRRTHLEGWDLELALRRMANRLRQARPRRGAPTGAVTVLLLGLLLGSLPLPAPAVTSPDPELARQRIQEILSDEAFRDRELRERWRYTGEREAKDRDVRFDLGLDGLTAVTLKTLSWVMAIVFLLWVASSYRRWSALLPRAAAAGRAPQAPTVLMGLDIRPEQLPTRLAEQALALWRRGEAAAAMSLLYRGALGHLVHKRGLTLSDGATEGDCLAEVNRHLPEVAAYFAALTDAWRSVAYADRRPADATVDSLCREFDRHFGEAA